jgi:hypothetical protein
MNWIEKSNQEFLSILKQEDNQTEAKEHAYKTLIANYIENSSRQDAEIKLC